MVMVTLLLMVLCFVQCIYSMEENYIKPSIIAPRDCKLKISEWNQWNNTWNIVFLEKIKTGEVALYPSDYKVIICKQSKQVKDNKCINDQFTWINFSRCLPHFFYNQTSIIKNKDIQFYACGYNIKFTPNPQTQLLEKKFEEEVFQYSFLSAESQQLNIKKQKICRIAFDKEKDSPIYSMIHFFDFPILLKAILASSDQDEKRCNVEGVTLMHFLNGVSLSADYHYSCNENNSFEKLPGYIKDPIIKHYAQQSNKTNSKIQ